MARLLNVPTSGFGFLQLGVRVRLGFRIRANFTVRVSFRVMHINDAGMFISLSKTTEKHKLGILKNVMGQFHFFTAITLK